MTPLLPRSTRRGVLAGAALAAGALPAAARLPAAPASDRELLALLALVEQIQIDHYGAILDAFDDDAFLGEGFPAGTRDRVAAMLGAEETQFLALNSDTPGAMGIPPIAGPRAALSDAATLENLATSAYAGSIPRIGRQGLLPELVGIHSVEARHAAWLAALLGADPFPEAIDLPLPPAEIVARLQAIGESAAPAGTPAADEDFALAIAAIAAELGVAPDEVQVIAAEPRDWPDSSLGCPREGQVYLEVITPGFLVTVSFEGEEIAFHTDRRGNVVRCV